MGRQKSALQCCPIYREEGDDIIIFFVARWFFGHLVFQRQESGNWVELSPVGQWCIIDRRYPHFSR
jgi:hypothetical protein